ncbi:cell division protein FtsL [Bosea sp. (in: a-proteobacteria)]|jgi:cell division protein FtsL|uniref:cell division protein FtsL n=1 Tax=Bosea sp. (in: a-proteobacteria) TaxID=1871050 RepID=UPI003F7084AC
MIKLLHVIAIGALVSSALYAYTIKYETTLEAEQLQKLKGKAQRERDAIAVLKAEWQYLNRPDRLQALADRHLDLQPLAINQIVRVSDIPNRGPKVDSIGRKLADLGLGLPTETPKDRKASGVTTPGGRP